MTIQKFLSDSPATVAHVTIFGPYDVLPHYLELQSGTGVTWQPALQVEFPGMNHP